MPAKVTVFGSGSFGTAMAFVLAHNNHQVIILGRNEEIVSSINNLHKNSRYFPDFVLPSNISATTNAKEALQDCEFTQFQFRAAPNTFHI